jgi:hypothetical protein
MKLVLCNRNFYPNNLLVINTQDKFEVLTVAKMIFFWVMTPCRHASEKNTDSLFRTKEGSITNEAKIVGNRSAQFHVTTVPQQPFHVTLHVTSNLRELYFLLNNSLKFYETDFTQLVSCVCDSPKEQSPWESNSRSETCMSYCCS